MGMGISHLVAAMAMAAAMIVEKCILSGCVLKMVLYWIVGESRLSSGSSRRLCVGRDATYIGEGFRSSGPKVVIPLTLASQSHGSPLRS